MFKCLCGRYSNFGTTCAFCSKDLDIQQEEVERDDLFYLVEKKDWAELEARIRKEEATFS